jgi:very-short-patch-repair endonuclease
MPSKRSPTDIHTLPKVKGFRTALRKKLTPAEAIFWNMVKNSRLDGRKFRRQHSIGNYIFDFYCPSERLAIELDGEGHYTDNPKIRDRSKRLFAEEHGTRLLRFENKMVFEDAEWILNVIRSHFDWWRREGATATFK